VEAVAIAATINNALKRAPRLAVGCALLLIVPAELRVENGNVLITTLLSKVINKATEVYGATPTSGGLGMSIVLCYNDISEQLRKALQEESANTAFADQLDKLPDFQEGVKFKVPSDFFVCTLYFFSMCVLLISL
jgi:hypothetical protein